MKPIAAILLKDIRIQVPNTNLTVTFVEDTFIKIDPSTQVAWIQQYQIELDRSQYTLIC